MRRLVLMIISSCALHFAYAQEEIVLDSISKIQPKINATIQDMSIKGASMFLQYKVSDQFKIQTRVSISNHQSPWEPLIN